MRCILPNVESDNDNADEFEFQDYDEDEVELRCFQRFIKTLSNDEMFVGFLVVGVCLYCLF